jgi:hypothetical protein
LKVLGPSASSPPKKILKNLRNFARHKNALLLSSLTTSITTKQPTKYMVENPKSPQKPTNHHNHFFIRIFAQYLGPIVLPFLVRLNCGRLSELESPMDSVQIEQKSYEMPHETGCPALWR